MSMEDPAARAARQPGHLTGRPARVADPQHRALEPAVEPIAPLSPLSGTLFPLAAPMAQRAGRRAGDPAVLVRRLVAELGVPGVELAVAFRADAWPIGPDAVPARLEVGWEARAKPPVAPPPLLSQMRLLVRPARLPAAAPIDASWLHQKELPAPHVRRPHARRGAAPGVLEGARLAAGLGAAKGSASFRLPRKPSPRKTAGTVRLLGATGWSAGPRSRRMGR